jgi:mono/diheme cytochrome c family protein
LRTSATEPQRNLATASQSHGVRESGSIIETLLVLRDFVTPWLFPVRGSVTLWLICLNVAVAGCRQDMHDQPKYIPFRESTFFGDQQSARPVVAGTVARGQLHEDALLYTGKVNGGDATVFPFAIDEQRLRRGQERFNIYCSPCHARTGEGDGMIVRRGYRRPPSYHDDRLRNAPVGHFFDVITNGFGAMPDYAAQIAVEDRWAIAAYIRALQLSAHATVSDVPADRRDRLR